jgi:flagellar biosynthesis protein FlhB
VAADTERGERTEEATQQRREEFRRKGQVAQTRELSAVFSLFGILLSIWLFGHFFLTQLLEVFTQSISHFFLLGARQGEWREAALFAGQKLFWVTSPVLGLFWVVALSSSWIQVGFLYNEDALQWRWERLNPVTGFQRIASLKSLVEGLKALLKLVVVAVVAWLTLREQIRFLPFVINYEVPQMITYLGDVVFRLVLGVGTLMAVLAGMDFLFQRWDIEQEMMMTKEEVKEEVKSREGDPMIRARIKRVQRELASRRMMGEIPKADVIITNPTHIACALKYDDTMVSPRLIAKGADLIAEKIKAIAREHNIPLVENKPLARTIFKTLKIGQSIPRELYTAVAEVLAYVFKLRRKV